MSDTDNQEPVAANDGTVEFSNDNLFDEPVETSLEEAKPDTEEVPASPTEPEEPEAEEAPAESPETAEAPEQPVEEKSETELKGMTRAERKEYFESLKQEAKPEIEQAVDAAYQPQDLEQLKEHYINQGADEFQALQLARQDISDQKVQLAEAKAEIVELNANLRTDTLEAQAKFDWMNPKADTYDKDLHQMAADLFATGMQVDSRTGQIIAANMTPMQAAAIIDKARNSGMAKAQLRAQKAAEAQMAAAAPPTSTAPTSSTSAEDKQASGLERAFNDIR